MARMSNHRSLGRNRLAGLGYNHGDPMYDQYGQFIGNYVDASAAPPPPAVAYYIPPAPGAAPTPNTSGGYVAPPPPVSVYVPDATPGSAGSYGAGNTGVPPAPPPQSNPVTQEQPKATVSAPYYFSAKAASPAGQAFRAFVIPRANTAAGLAEIAVYMRNNAINAQLAAEYMNPEQGDTLAAATQRVIDNFKAAGFTMDSQGMPVKGTLGADRTAAIKAYLSTVPNNRPDLILKFIDENDVTYGELQTAMGWSTSEVDKILASGYTMTQQNGPAQSGTTANDPYAGSYGGLNSGGIVPDNFESIGGDDNKMLLAGLGVLLVGGLVLMNSKKKTANRRPRKGGKRARRV